MTGPLLQNAAVASLKALPSHVTSVLMINLGAIAKNLEFLKAYVGPRTAVYPVLKADAYGLGMEPVARALSKKGATRFFVATVEEGVALRAALPFAQIFVLNGLWPGVEEIMAAQRLVPVLPSLPQISLWRSKAKALERRLPAMLQLETGLLRLGLHEGDLEAASWDGIEICGVMSHLACAYQKDHPFNDAQRERFDALRQAYFQGIPASLSGSGGIFQGSSFFYNVVRPGRFLYGSAWTGGTEFEKNVNPVVQLAARVLQVQEVAAGASIGYDQTFVAPRPMKIATLAFGYADGYMRSLSNKGVVRLAHGVEAPVVGRVSMDLMTVDVTDLSLDQIFLGDWALLLGEDETVDDMADRAGTVSWEILTRLGRRPYRLYWGGADDGRL